MLLFEEFSRDYLTDMGIIVSQDGIEYELELQEAHCGSGMKENEIDYKIS